MTALDSPDSSAHRGLVVLLLLCLAMIVLASGCSQDPSTASAVERVDATPSATPGLASIASPTPSAPTPVPPPTPEPPKGPLAGRRICIDPGHDAYWAVGATGYDGSGKVPVHPVEQVPLHEHELTLSVAYRLKALLEADGAEVCVTRRPRAEGGGTYNEPYDYNGDGRVRSSGQAIEDNPERIQPRIDSAIAFEADVLLAIHFNGLDDRRVRGTEVYYSDTGARQTDNRRLAGALLTGLLTELRASGFPAVDRGLRSDNYMRYSDADLRRMTNLYAGVIRANGAAPESCADCSRLVTLGNNPMSLHKGTYAGALVEIEFLSNPEVVETLIMRSDALDLIAGGLKRGLSAYYEMR